MIPGRNFSLYLAGATLSSIGTAMVPVALSFAVLSRVMSVVQLADMGLTPLGYVLAAPAAALLGAHAALGWAASCVLLSAGALLSVADIRRFGAPMRSANAISATL